MVVPVSDEFLARAARPAPGPARGAGRRCADHRRLPRGAARVPLAARRGGPDGPARVGRATRSWRRRCTGSRLRCRRAACRWCRGSRTGWRWCSPRSRSATRSSCTRRLHRPRPGGDRRPAEIHSGVTIAPWVTIGLRAGDYRGAAIERNVSIGTGAKVIGGVPSARGRRSARTRWSCDDVPRRARRVVGGPLGYREPHVAIQAQGRGERRRPSSAEALDWTDRGRATGRDRAAVRIQPRRA